MRPTAYAFLPAVLFLALSAPAADRPSRPPQKGCTWEKAEDASIGLAAWVERCDFGFRKIDLFLKGSSLLVRYSDGGEPEPLVDVFDLREGEAPDAGLRRLFSERTPRDLARRCVLAPYRGAGAKGRAGVRRFTFVPNAALARELRAKESPDEVPEPPCGDWGEAPDGVQYWETQRGARRVLFVRVGQDEPPFDENSLRVLPDAR